MWSLVSVRERLIPRPERGLSELLREGWDEPCERGFGQRWEGWGETEAPEALRPVTVCSAVFWLLWQ